MSQTIIPANGVYLTDADCSEKINYYESSLAHLGCTKCSNPCNAFGKTLPTIQFIVTESCNLACTYCYETCKTNRMMSKEVAKKAIDFLLDGGVDEYFEKDHTGGFIIEFFGGEPTMNIEVMQFIADYFFMQCYLKKPEWFANSMLSASSNGTLFFKQEVQDFIKKYRDQLSFAITIDGNKELHDACRVFHDGRGSYDVVEKAVKTWNEISYTSKTTKVTFAPANIANLYESMLHLWENVGVQFIYANCVFEEGWTHEDAKVFYKQLKKLVDYLLENRLYDQYYTSLFSENLGVPDVSHLDQNTCGGNGSMLAIAPDGKLYTCMRFMDYSLSKQKEQSIGDIENGIDMTNPWLIDLKAVTVASQSDEACLTCPATSLCGGCTGYNYDTFGTPNKRATYHCEMVKVQAIISAYYYNKIYELEGIDKHIDEPFENIYEEA